MFIVCVLHISMIKNIIRFESNSAKSLAQNKSIYDPYVLALY